MRKRSEGVRLTSRVRLTPAFCGVISENTTLLALFTNFDLAGWKRKMGKMKIEVTPMALQPTPPFVRELVAGVLSALLVTLSSVHAVQAAPGDLDPTDPPGEPKRP